MSEKMQRFTQRARQVLSLAQDEAERLRHSYIGTEHVLIGLMHEEGSVAGRALRALGLDIHDVEALVERKTRPGQRAPFSKIDLSPGTRRVLELAVEEAARTGQAYIGTEHLLLALINNPDDLLAEILTELEITPDAIRGQILIILTSSRSGLPRPMASRRRAAPGGREWLPQPSAPPSGESGKTGSGIWNAAALRVLSLAQSEAEKLEHREIGPEHLLLGLAQEREGAAAPMLDRALGGNIGLVRVLITQRSTIQKREPSSEVKLPEATKTILTRAAGEMRRTEYTYIGPEHILLALIGGPDNVATEIIGLGEVPADEIRAKIEEALAGGRSG